LLTAGSLSLPAAVVAFAVGAVALVAASVFLARGADRFAELTGATRLMVGTLLLAFATSLPEVVTGVAAAVGSAPDLAVGNVFGSSMANMAILAIIDLRHRGIVLPAIEVGHARIAALAIVLTCIGALAIYVPDVPAIGWVGPGTVVIAVAYVAGMYSFRNRPPRALVTPLVKDTIESESTVDWTLARTIAVLAVATTAVLVSGPAVAIGARDIAAATGVGETFVGTTLLAVSTSLPELVTTLAAVRMGSYDLAVGNLFGSNAANMVVLLPVDLAFLGGPVLGVADEAQVIGAFGAILLMGIASASIIGGDRTTRVRFEPDAAVLLIAYLAMVGLLGVAAA
jgi:cation:H+ antiporter